MKNNKLLEYIADASIITIALIWGSTFIVVKQGVESVEPVTFMFFRFLIASAVMIVAAIPFLKKTTKGLMRDGLLLGFYLFITFLFQTIAIKLSPATEVAFLTGLYVLFVPVLSALFFKKKPHLFSVIGVALSTAGMLLVTFDSGIGLSTGQIYAVINAFFIGLYILEVDKYSRRHNVVLLTTIQIVFTTILSGGYAYFFETQDMSAVLQPDIIYSLIFLAVFATVVCFFVQTAMQKHTTPTKAAIMFTFEPISSPFFSYIIGGELLSMRQYAGAALIVVAIITAEVGTALRYAAKGKKS